MKKSRLLQEIGRRLEEARLRNPDRPGRKLLVHWPDLLEVVTIHDAEEFGDELDALREAEKNNLVSIEWNRRNRDEPAKIRIPFDAEEDLFDLLDTREPKELLLQTRGCLERAAQWNGERWKRWCNARIALLDEGKPVYPLRWRRPESILPLLEGLYSLDQRKWEDNTYIRAASVAIGFDSKRLSAIQTTMETLLSDLRGQPTNLADLGIVETPRTILMAGPIQLHFEHRVIVPGHTAGAYGLISEQVHLARTITTSAKRIITVENHTTFHQIAGRDERRETLILQSSYPTRGIVALFKKLPLDIPCYHFGDTDPAGYEILHQLRIETKRQILPFLMSYLAGDKPLSETDRQILERLLKEAEEDIRPALQSMAASGTKGHHEQERYEKPNLPEWPFYALPSQGA